MIISLFRIVHTYRQVFPSSALSARNHDRLLGSQADGPRGHRQVQAGHARQQREADPLQRQAPLHSQPSQLHNRHQISLFCSSFHSWRRAFFTSTSCGKIQES